MRTLLKRPTASMDGVHQRTSPRSINRLNIGDIIMLQIISIEHQTAVRANVITNRTGDASIGIMKSMMILKFYYQLMILKQK